jgi:hypothetical protein
LWYKRSDFVRAVLLLLALSACSSSHRRVTVVPSLPDGCLAGRNVNEVQLAALGDFPPSPQTSAAAGRQGSLSLDLPDGTKVISVVGLGPDGPAAFGRTAPFDLGALGDLSGAVPIAYGPLDGLCPTGALHDARSGHRATLLADGNVLISGGTNGDIAVAPLELYLPAGDLTTPPAQFRAAASLSGNVGQLGHSASLLGDGTVLLAGGVQPMGGVPFGIAFDGLQRVAADGTLDGPPGLLGGGPRAFHSATVLADGRVVFLGGCPQFQSNSCVTPLATASIYDPHTSTFADGPALLHARWDHDAVLRPDGSILVVGGGQPAELYDPDEPRGQEAGTDGARAALLPTGAVAIADASLALWQSVAEGAQPLSAPTAAPGTLTALEDGALLAAGGGLASLTLWDGAGASATPVQFARIGHSATRLLDGSVLIAGGAPLAGVVPGPEAFVYLRSPLGPYATPPTLTFDTPGGYDARRPDRVALAGGLLRVAAPSAGEGGRPGELALMAGAEVADFTLELDVGRQGAAGAAILIGWQSAAQYAWIALEPGRAVQLFTVTPGVAGQSLVAADAGCVGAMLGDGDLPDGNLTHYKVDFRGGLLAVDKRLACIPAQRLGRGQIGVGALHGTAVFDNLALSR